MIFKVQYTYVQYPFLLSIPSNNRARDHHLLLNHLYLYLCHSIQLQYVFPYMQLRRYEQPSQDKQPAVEVKRKEDEKKEDEKKEDEKKEDEKKEYEKKENEKKEDEEKKNEKTEYEKKEDEKRRM